MICRWHARQRQQVQGSPAPTNALSPPLHPPAGNLPVLPVPPSALLPVSHPRHGDLAAAAQKLEAAVYARPITPPAGGSSSGEPAAAAGCLVSWLRLWRQALGWRLAHGGLLGTGTAAPGRELLRAASTLAFHPASPPCSSLQLLAAALAQHPLPCVGSSCIGRLLPMAASQPPQKLCIGGGGASPRDAACAARAPAPAQRLQQPPAVRLAAFQAPEPTHAAAAAPQAASRAKAPARAGPSPHAAGPCLAMPPPLDEVAVRRQLAEAHRIPLSYLRALLAEA